MTGTAAPAVELGGRYVLGGRGRASVEAEGFEARDLLLGRPVLVAVERERVGADPALHSLHVAALAARGRMPSHAGLPRLLDEGELERGGRRLAWAVSEPVAGLPVDRFARPGRLGDAEWAQLLLHAAWQLAAVLAAVHAAGLVHGAVGPDTVLIGGDRAASVRVALVDLGPQPEQVGRLAALDGRATARLWARWAGVRLYPAPEVEAGHPPTPRSDVYGFGCVLATLLADQPEPDWAELLTPPAHADVIRELRELAAGCRNEKPADRPYSFLLVAERLETIMAATAADQRAPGLGSAVLERAAERELPADLVALLARVAERVPAAWLNRIPGWRRLAVRAGLPQRREQTGRTVAPVLARPVRPRRAPSPEGVRRAQRAWVVVLSIVLVAGVVAGALYAHFTAAGTVAALDTVPAVAGLNPQQAGGRLEQAGFLLGGRHDEYSTSPAGQVTGTDPAQGAHVARGTAVVLTVSSGPELVAVPGLTGLDETSATAALGQAGLSVGTVAQQDGNVPAGRVLASDPAGGKAAAGSAVNLVIASGQQRVPAGLVGTDQASAVAALNAAGFTVSVLTQDSTSAASGQVLAASPGSGQRADAGSTVRLTVARLVTVPSTTVPSAPATPAPTRTPAPGASAPPSSAPTAPASSTPPPSETIWPPG